MKRFLCSTGVMLTGILLCTAAFALGPPGPAHNGGTGSGVDNFYAQLPTKTAEQNNTPATTQAAQTQKPEKDNYPRYVSTKKVSNRFAATKP
ncbi:hypothetical protein [Kaarinaea lacus]